MNFKHSSILLLSLATSYSAFAADKDKSWDITSEVGAIITSGNTETTTLKGGIKAKHNLVQWNNEYRFDGIYKEDEVTDEDGNKKDQRTNEKYSLSGQANYKINQDHSHLYILGSYVSDSFGAYRSESLLSVGYGQRLLDTDNMKLKFDVGPGVKRFEHQDTPKNGERYEDEFIGVAKVDYEWTISGNAKFTQVIGVEYGDTNTKTRSESALFTKINGALQMKLAYNITHNSDVDDDKENTDSETSLTLVYSF